MTPQIEERIEIIKELKTTMPFKDYSLEKRIKRLRWGYFGYIGVNILLMFLILVSASALFHLEMLHYNWNRSMLLVAMTISLSWHSHFSFIEFLLSKHHKKLITSDFNFDQESNSELQNLINRLNYRRFKPYWIMIPSILIAIAAIVILLMTEETMTPKMSHYWNQFPLPVFVMTLLLLWNMNYMVFRVRRNIKNVESGMNDN
jgi:H+/gluconate symporter-like permease